MKIRNKHGFRPDNDPDEGQEVCALCGEDRTSPLHGSQGVVLEGDEEPPLPSGVDPAKEQSVTRYWFAKVSYFAPEGTTHRNVALVDKHPLSQIREWDENPGNAGTTLVLNWWTEITKEEFDLLKP